MIKNLIKGVSVSLVCAALCATAENKSALNGVYLKAGAGVMKYNRFRKTENGYTKKNINAEPIYNIGVGYNITNAVRTDLNFQYGELNYKYSESDYLLRQRIRTQAVLLNGYYDFHLHNSIVPYFTAGIGVGRNKAGNLKLSLESTEFPEAPRGRTTTNFIWNVGAGAKYNLNKNFALDLAYKYMDMGFSRTIDANAAQRGGRQKIAGHQVMGSLIYSF